MYQYMPVPMPCHYVQRAPIIGHDGMSAAVLMGLCSVSTFVSWLPAQVMPRTSTNFLEAAARPIPGIADSFRVLSLTRQPT